ncbi:MAG: hypothetical protein FWC36_03930 [Spirochaetes bacterium]|nr:hypothetical protein [Spirochaetota bacterium]
MIVKMKKVSLVILDSAREDALEKLRKLGVVHIEKESKSTEALNSLMEKRSLFEKVINAFPRSKNKQKLSGKPDLAEADKIVTEANKILEKIHSLIEEIDRDKKDILTLTPWGDFDPSSVSVLEKDGIFLRFYVLAKEQFAKIPQEAKYVVVAKAKGINYIVTVALKGEAPVDIIGDRLVLPAAGLKQLSENIKKKDAEIIQLKKELEKLADKKEIVTEGFKELMAAIDFEGVNAEMGKEERFAYLSGYVPVDLADKVKEAAAANTWALLIKDPEVTEDPPTLLKNNRVIEFMKPLLKFLDIAPGYREIDISPFFLLFFTVFVGILVGDAGYGILVLTALIVMRFTMKNFKGPVFGLLCTLSVSIIAWGILTGNWFASATLSQVPQLYAMTIPEISSFKDTATNIMQLSFLIAMVHLTLGFLIGFVRKMPSLAAFANIGNLFILYGAYFLVQFLLMGAALNPITLPLVAIGFVILMICGSQEKGRCFFKGLLFGVASSPMTAINSVSIFGDIISYIRLYAVGLAGWSVANSFNNMAAGVAEGLGGPLGIILAIMILFAAHTFNMMLCALGVIVHGVRLNILEFGLKAGMEWSGRPYDPFRRESA